MNFEITPDLKRAIKSKKRYIISGCPKCRGFLYQSWEEYSCAMCGLVIYGDLIDTYDPQLIQISK